MLFMGGGVENVYHKTENNKTGVCLAGSHGTGWPIRDHRKQFPNSLRPQAEGLKGTELRPTRWLRLKDANFKPSYQTRRHKLSLAFAGVNAVIPHLVQDSKQYSVDEGW
jgi:hypothetical protein